MKSVFLTGASGVGKSTTYNILLEHGYEPSPYHITREPRQGEVPGRDAIYISEQEFMTNLDKGIYLESTAEEAVYANVYYGSPRKWIDDMESSEPFVAMPANAFILSALCKTLEEREKRNNVIWANLTAPLEIRRSRIEHRVKDQKSLEIRLHSGVTQGILADADVNIDTSIHDPTQVLDIITTITR